MIWLFNPIISFLGSRAAHFYTKKLDKATKKFEHDQVKFDKAMNRGLTDDMMSKLFSFCLEKSEEIMLNIQLPNENMVKEIDFEKTRWFFQYFIFYFKLNVYRITNKMTF